ncbi:MAG: CBS domain-containing protein [Bdellovibrionales bacterium]|nr:CBS domain-containing protein [Bdellovibrionales bacterium]
MNYYNPDIKDYMAKFPFVTSPEATLDEALDYMEKTGVRHLPVLRKGELVGVVSERDLMAGQSDDSKTVGDVMSGPPWVVAETEPLSSVVHWMAKQKIGSALVVNEAGKLLGIFTTTDALLILSRMLGGGDFRDHYIGAEVGVHSHPIHLAVV